MCFDAKQKFDEFFDDVELVDMSERDSVADRFMPMWQ